MFPTIKQNCEPVKNFQLVDSGNCELVKLCLTHRKSNKTVYHSMDTTSKFNEVDKQEAMRKLMSYNFKSSSTPPPSLNDSWSSDFFNINNIESDDKLEKSPVNVNVAKKILKNLRYNKVNELVQHNYNEFENITMKSPYSTCSTKLRRGLYNRKLNKNIVHINKTLSRSITSKHSEQKKISLYDLGSEMKVLGFSPNILKKSLEIKANNSSHENNKTKSLQSFNILKNTKVVRISDVKKSDDCQEKSTILFEQYCNPINYRLNIKLDKNKM